MKNSKIIWKLLLGISILLLVLFILFILLLDLSGSMGTIYITPPTIWQEIEEYISMRIYIIVAFFPFYVIPLAIDIFLIITSKNKIKKQ